jgi:FtsZ-interacting cell division protein ZipA
MEQQVPSSVPPQAQPQEQPRLTPEQVEELKRIAKERAIQQIMGQRPTPGVPQPQGSVPVQTPLPTQQNVVYVRRPLTVAEIIIVFVISCGIVTGGQLLWQGINDFLPRIEIKMK